MWWPIVIVAMAGIAVTAVTFEFARRSEDERIRGSFELRAEWRASDLVRKLEGIADLTGAAATFITANPQALVEDFASFVGNYRKTNVTPLTRAIVWAPYVRHADRDSFEQEVSRRRGADFRILDVTAGREFVTAAERDFYVPYLSVLLAEDSTVTAPIGIDVARDPARRAAVLRSAEERRAVASRPVAVQTVQAASPAFQIFVPVFVPRQPGTAGPEFELRGFVLGSFLLDPVLAFAIANTPATIETIELFAVPSVELAGARPIAVYSPSAGKFETGAVAASKPGDVFHAVVRSFVFLGQTWTAVSYFPDSEAAKLRSPILWFWPIGGLLLTGLLMAYMYRRHQRLRQIESQVAMRTVELAEANAGLTGAAKSLAEARDTFRAVIESSPVAILALAPDRTVMVWNPAAEQIFGYAPEEVLDRPYALVPKGGEAEFEALVTRALAGERQRNVEVTRRRKDGKLRRIRFSGAPMHQADGRVKGVIYALEDITDRREVEQQLRQSQKLEAVGQLTGGIAHDFNNILGVVVGNLDLLAEEIAPDSEAARLSKAALDAALRGGELTQRLLAFARRQPLTPSIFAVGEAIETMLPLLRRSLGEKIALDAHLAAGSMRVQADKHQLENAILNLCINARDAMPRGGGITIACSDATIDTDHAPLYPDIPPGHYVVVSVSDNGTGISSELLPRVFEPFFTTKEAGRGTGLGLSMVYGFMRQSDGTAKIYSEPGQGTTVRLYFPKVDQPAAELEAAQAVAAMPRGSETVLVVEDQPDVRAVAVKTLTRLGYKTLETGNAADAIALLARDNGVEAVFSDIVMPGEMSGLDLAVELRQRQPPLPVLLTSGYASPQALREKASNLGLTVIAKPYRAAELARHIRAILDADG